MRFGKVLGPVLTTAMVGAASAQTQIAVDTTPWYLQGDPIFNVPVIAWVIGIGVSGVFIYLGLRGGKR